jgi:glycerate kinase
LTLLKREVLMYIVVAPQALKGSLTAVEAGQAITIGVQTIYPQAEIRVIPMADGGEGTVQAFVTATGGEIIPQTAMGPLDQAVEAFYGLLGDGKTAVIEMAACAGLPLLKPEQRDPRRTTTYGVGELIRAALDRGCRSFLIGIGGSATNDGGTGMAQALGAALCTDEGKPIARGGAALSTLASISLKPMDPRLQECTFDVACDVTNPLCGPQGASAVYGPQKGATPEMVEQLDAALSHYATILERDLHCSVAQQPGAGAAGGLGAGLLVFLHATLRPGAQILIETLQLEKHIRQADLVITAEGQIDEQTMYGKSVGAIARLAKRYHVPVIALAGSLSPNHHVVYDLGIDAINVLPSSPMSLDAAMKQAAPLITQATERALRFMKVGESIRARRKREE